MNKKYQEVLGDRKYAVSLALVCGAVEPSGQDALSCMYPGRNPLILSLVSTFSVSFGSSVASLPDSVLFVPLPTPIFFFFFFWESGLHYYHKVDITSLRLATNREQEKIGERHVVPTGYRAIMNRLKNLRWREQKRVESRAAPCKKNQCEGKSQHTQE